MFTLFTLESVKIKKKKIIFFWKRVKHYIGRLILSPSSSPLPTVRTFLLTYAQGHTIWLSVDHRTKDQNHE